MSCSAQNGSVGVSAAGAGSDEVAVLYGEVRRGFAVPHQPKFWTRQFWIVTLYPPGLAVFH
jgi:hypothetical protein